MLNTQDQTTPLNTNKDTSNQHKTFTIVKRDGTIVAFHKDRILKALDLAMRDTKNIHPESPLPSDITETINIITKEITNQLSTLAKKQVSITVEGIQDLVEITLMKHDYHDVARDYIIYRDQHNLIREDDPSNIKVIRKGHETSVKFNPIKIASSLENIFKQFYQFSSQIPNDIISVVNTLTQNVVKQAVLSAQNKLLNTDKIQDLIEDTLMQTGYFKLAKHYILYRAKQGKQTEKPVLETHKKRPEKDNQKIFTYKSQSGESLSIKESELLDRLDHACRHFESIVNPESLLESTVLNFYEGITEDEIDQALIIATKSYIEKDPLYSKIAARLLLDKLYRETLSTNTMDPHLNMKHMTYFKEYISHGISIKQLAPELETFDLDRLASQLVLERDDLFQYLGLQTLYDRYFLHENMRRLETPQIFWMRVSMGLAILETDKTEKAIEFYNMLSTHAYLSATPTLFNAGTTHPQLSSCYLATIDDNLDHIFKTISDDAKLSKWAGGLGNDWSNVRGTGSHIQGTNGKSQGIIPFLKVANDTALAVNQGGKRKGAMCAYLETWHIDIEDFIELRKNTGDERRRTHDMNTANWIPDLFMKRVRENGSWTLFSPDEAPDLHDLYGKAFETRYLEYEKRADSGKLSLWKRVEAVQLWRSILGMLFETGHPWITFKDPSNIRSPQDHTGVVHSSNLCTEILLNTSNEETAVCNLGSINLAEHTTIDGLNKEKLSKTIRTAIRMLDNVIDINFYPIPETQYANMTHRAIGLGLMGFQDALNILKISYASHEAVEFADRSMEMISYYALLYSSELSKERNPYPSYKGSKWERGLLPIDTIDLLEKERGETIYMDRKTTMNWAIVRDSIAKHGMRHSNVMAIAPTATIANIAGVTASIEPNYKNLYAKSNLSGEFTFSNPYLVKALKKLNIWDDEMIDDLKYFDGSVLEIERIPKDLKSQFLTAFEIDPEWIIECASRRQKWIDQSQSLNLYLAEPSGKKLDNMYQTAWEKGIKTCYYCRTLGATSIEKSTLNINKRKNLQPRWMKSSSPSSRVNQLSNSPQVPVCNLEDGCESCQ